MDVHQDTLHLPMICTQGGHWTLKRHAYTCLNRCPPVTLAAAPLSTLTGEGHALRCLAGVPLAADPPAGCPREVHPFFDGGPMLTLTGTHLDAWREPRLLLVLLLAALCLR